MRILANENFPGDAITALRQRGHDVAWVRTEAPGSSDWQVLTRAGTEGSVVEDARIRMTPLPPAR